MSTETVRAAYEALGRGDVEPLVSLMDDELEWRGVTRPWLFWRPPPS